MTLRNLIRTIPDHPKPGIQFRDITTLLSDAEGFRQAVDEIADQYRSRSIDLVAGIEARGFVFGAAVAYRLGIGFIPVRKPGKLPGETRSREYDLEYGTDRLEVHVDCVSAGQSVLLVDDLIATGGTALAALDLLRELDASVVDACFVVALPDLGGVEALRRAKCDVYSVCEFAGD